MSSRAVLTGAFLHTMGKYLQIYQGCLSGVRDLGVGDTLLGLCIFISEVSLLILYNYHANERLCRAWYFKLLPQLCCDTRSNCCPGYVGTFAAVTGWVDVDCHLQFSTAIGYRWWGHMASDWPDPASLSHRQTCQHLQPATDSLPEQHMSSLDGWAETVMRKINGVRIW